MAEHNGIVNPETHHEKSDVNVRALIWSVVIFIAFGIVTHFLLWGMFEYFAELSRGSTNAPLTAVARPADAAIPVEPRLQPFPTREPDGVMNPPNSSTPEVGLEKMRRDQETALREPAWLDQEKGIVRVPIDVAKQLVVQRGLPVVGGQQ